MMPNHCQPPIRSGVCERHRAASSSLIGLLIVAGVLVPCSVALGATGQRVIWNFDHTLANTLGGGYNAFSREPSWARTYLAPAVHLSSSKHSLRITAHREWQGFCGVWLNFYPAASGRYFDARPYPYLSFLIKGRKPGGDFDIKLVDARGKADEDNLDTRPLHDYLPAGITTDWQKVTIPLADFPEIDPGSLVRLVLIFTVPGDYEFYIDDISFESAISHPQPVPSAGALKPLAPQEPPPYHSMWVWKTKNLLESARAANLLFDFCSRNGVKEIYFSVNFQKSSGNDASGPIKDGAANGDFLSAAHLRGLRVEALAGTPGWATDPDHSRAQAAVRAVLAYNSRMTPDARFDGVHFDVEPYLLLGFAVPEYRKQILGAYLEMVAECAKIAREGRLDFNVDIPWWFYPVSAAAKKEFTVTFHGRNETVGQHITDLLHSVTIMDYRNEADGTGGIISFGIPALAYAARVHKKILVGLETSAEKETPVEFVLAIPAKSFSAKLQETGLAERTSFEGYAVHVLSAGNVTFVGLGPERSGPAPSEPMAGALAHLRKLFGSKSSALFHARATLAEARTAIDENPAWKDFQPVEIRETGAHRKISAFRAIRRTPPVTTFHGLGRHVFEEESRSAAEWLGAYSSFSGLAVHYYQSFRTLMTAPPTTGNAGVRPSQAK